MVKFYNSISYSEEQQGQISTTILNKTQKIIPIIENSKTTKWIYAIRWRDSGYSRQEVRDWKQRAPEGRRGCR